MREFITLIIEGASNTNVCRYLAVVHALVMVYQLLCLNVAINSYDNALLSLLMSNQFVEIKGSVFKKFEKDNLFQITCAGALHFVFYIAYGH